jgi:endonuclease/exonuclease/phosphatase family metal-dependent hydrolase
MISRVLFSSIVILALSGCSKTSPSGNANPANPNGNSATPPVAKDKVAIPSSESAGNRANDKPDGKKSAPAQLKIASYNINWRNADLPALAETIRKADADVVCLQEANKESEKYLEKTLGKVYPYIRFQGNEGKYLAEGFCILSRVPVTAYEFIPPSQGIFGAFAAEIQFGGRAVQIISVHLQPVVFSENTKILEVISAIAAVETKHRGEIDAILKHLDGDIPAVILGDFNSVATFQSLGILKSKGFVDCFAETHENPEAFPSWHWPTQHGEISLRIDYIFHSPDFRSLESNVIKSEVSDHFLIYSRLEWAGK